MAAVPVFAKELLAWVAQGALWPLSTRVMVPPSSPSVPRVTFLLHGYFAPPSVMLPLRRALARRVEGEVVIFGYGGPMDVAHQARRFGRFVERAHPAGRIDLVGHSFGGLVARYWAQELGGADRVDRLVTLATPHRGTKSAHLLPAAREMRPGSDLLRRLDASAGTLAGVRLTTVAAGGDLMVLPPQWALIEGSETHEVADLGHNGLLFSSRVFAIVADALTR